MEVNAARKSCQNFLNGSGPTISDPSWVCPWPTASFAQRSSIVSSRPWFHTSSNQRRIRAALLAMFQLRQSDHQDGGILARTGSGGNGGAPLLPRRGQQRDGFALVAAVDPKIVIVHRNDRVARIEFAHAHQAKIGEIRMAVGVAEGESPKMFELAWAAEPGGVP